MLLRVAKRAQKVATCDAPTSTHEVLHIREEVQHVVLVDDVPPVLGAELANGMLAEQIVQRHDLRELMELRPGNILVPRLAAPLIEPLCEDDSPAPSFSRMDSTVMRVPATTDFPRATSGSDTILASVMARGYEPRRKPTRSAAVAELAAAAMMRVGGAGVRAGALAHCAERKRS